MTTATAHDSLLDDLDDLDDSGSEEEQSGAAAASMAASTSAPIAWEASASGALTQSAAAAAMRAKDRTQSAVSVWDAAPLGRSAAFLDLMSRLSDPGAASTTETARELDNGGRIEHTPAYKLVLEANAAASQIHDAIDATHKYIQRMYAPRFPELESLVLGPLQYAAVVKLIGNQSDLSKVNLLSVISSAIAMVVTVTASAKSGHVLAERELRLVLEGCDAMQSLGEWLRKTEQFIESQMQLIAPNLSALVGTELAARLLSCTSGLAELARVPSSNILVLGKDAKSLAGLSLASKSLHEGLVYQADLVKTVPAALRRKAARMVANKVAMVVRCDAGHQQRDGSMGKELRETIIRALERIQEPNQPRMIKALPVPIDKPSKHRGGKRARRMKELYAQTELQKRANRMKFGTEEEDDELGMAADGDGSGTIRNTVQSKPSIGAPRPTSKKANAAAAAAAAGATSKRPTGLAGISGTSGMASGISSSVAWTPVQGIELVNPAALQEMRARTNGDFGDEGRYFGATTQYLGVKRARESTTADAALLSATPAPLPVPLRDSDGFAMPMSKKPRLA